MNRIFRRHVLGQGIWLACAGALTLLPLKPALAQLNTNLFTAAQRPPAPRRPSIILILADNIGYGDLGCYGQTQIKTPNLDKLAGEGIRFTSFYAGSPEDEQARVALLTGMRPDHSHGGFNQPLAPSALTVAEFLKQKGYHTGLIGEWNLGDIGPVAPVQKGFEEFAGFLSQGHARDYFTDTLWRHDPTTGFDGRQTIAENWNDKHGLYIPDLLTLGAVNFVKNNEPDQFNHYRPFFLCLAYPIPHNSYMPKDGPYSDEPWPQAEKDRAAMITRMDDGIGKLMDKLDALRINTNTVIFFTSVNGPKKEGAMDPKFFDSAGPLRGEQGSVYEGGIRLPMIVRWPAQIRPGQVSDFAWAAWDFLPTAAEIALTEPPKHLDGSSILPTLLDQAQTNHPAVFYWQSDQNGPQEALRTNVWKGVLAGTNGLQLYNLKSDIGEKHDLAEQQPDLVAKIKKLMTAEQHSQAADESSEEGKQGAR